MLEVEPEETDSFSIGVESSRASVLLASSEMSAGMFIVDVKIAPCLKHTGLLQETGADEIRSSVGNNRHFHSGTRRGRRNCLSFALENRRAGRGSAPPLLEY